MSAPFWYFHIIIITASCLGNTKIWAFVFQFQKCNRTRTTQIANVYHKIDPGGHFLYFIQATHTQFNNWWTDSESHWKMHSREQVVHQTQYPLSRRHIENQKFPSMCYHQNSSIWTKTARSPARSRSVQSVFERIMQINLFICTGYQGSDEWIWPALIGIRDVLKLLTIANCVRFIYTCYVRSMRFRNLKEGAQNSMVCFRLWNLCYSNDLLQRWIILNPVQTNAFWVSSFRSWTLVLRTQCVKIERTEFATLSSIQISSVTISTGHDRLSLLSCRGLSCFRSFDKDCRGTELSKHPSTRPCISIHDNL